jgi:hypothetical protein
LLFQVALVRAQLRRATERYGSKNSREISFAFAQPIEKDGDQSPMGNRLTRSRHIENSGVIKLQKTFGLQFQEVMAQKITLHIRWPVN